MRLKRNCIFFNANINGSATVDWGHELGQSRNNGYLMKVEGCSEIINGLVFNQVKEHETFSYGRGNVDNKEIEIISIFHNVIINAYDVEEDKHNTYTIDSPFLIAIIKETSGSHSGRRTLKMNIGFSYETIENKAFYDEINVLISNPWFAYSLLYDNKNTGLLTLTIIKAPQTESIENQPSIVYTTLNERNTIWDKIENDYTKKYDSQINHVESSIVLNQSNIQAENIIFFGSPGTGKSYSADEKTNGYIVEKTTFHPEYDYNSFVGGYKPIMNEEGEESKIEYKFVPQIFTNIYVNAWKDLNSHHFLQIEEINRGNCAEIFGDLFQLLDRDNEGGSKYEISASEELKTHLIKEFGDAEHGGISGNKLRLPNNLSIVATMNTSDQSLFPMDSAFKRRWNWEYVPIKYDCPESNFIINLGNDNKYNWLDFLKEVNQRIYKATQSQDKQIGNWFINAQNTDNIINEKTFINKVLFYLWNDVFKDEDETIFIKEEEPLTYEHFFAENKTDLIEYIFTTNLNLEPITETTTDEEEVVE
ncbi:MAG: AAA family ATPase [Campylobacterota bacterium]|nr:AAA family ATPase [Campylobacterota bacterium]